MPILNTGGVETLLGAQFVQRRENVLSDLPLRLCASA
jgi:hypothetical protein